MAKSEKKSAPTSTEKKSTGLKPSRKIEVAEVPLIPKQYQDLAAIGSLAILLCLFFFDLLFGGKAIVTPDNTASQATTTYLLDARRDGIFPLWFPYIFGGMPSNGSLFTTGDRTFDFLYSIWNFFIKVITLPSSANSAWVIFYFFLFGVGIYALLRVKNCTPFQSFVASLGGIFATLSLCWVASGHNTKMWAIAPLPFILIFIEKLQEKSDWKSFALFTSLTALALSVQARSTHVQMMYYGYMMIGIYFLFELISSLIKKDPIKNWLRSVSGFAVALLLGISLNADTYLSVIEYTPYSIRGGVAAAEQFPELTDSGNEAASKPLKKTGSGLDYDYATNWSFGVGEVITFFAPAYYGYGNSSYWGPQPFTGCPNFFGTTILLLAILGMIYYRKNSFVQALVAISIISLLLSFGKYFSLFFDLLFYYAPFFNKFRAPSLILILVTIGAAVLAGFGLKAIYEIREKHSEKLETLFKNIAIGTAVICFAGVIGFSGCKESYLHNIADSEKSRMIAAQNNISALQVAQYYDQQFKVFDMAKSDMTMSLIITALVLVGAYFFIIRKIPRTLFQAGLLILLFVDFQRADSKLFTNTLQDQKAEKNFFETTDYVDYLTKDTTKFRILPLIRDKESNWYAYFRLETVGGYHGAKMRLYQDLIELYGAGNTEMPNFFSNQVVMDLLDVKYILIDQPVVLPNYKVAFEGSKTVLENEHKPNRAWFVSSIEKKSVVEILKAIKAQNFDPKKVAYLENDVPKVDSPDSLSKVELVSSTIHSQNYRTTTSGNYFLFVSEIFYPAGWKCFINGSESEIYKTTYAFRGVVVPKGNHEVKFVFEPKAFALGKIISIVTNLLISVVLIFIGIDFARKRFGKSSEEKKSE